MQVVGKFQAVAPASTMLVQQALETVEAWKTKKFDEDSGGAAVVRRSGKEALHDQKEENIGDSKLVSFEVLEPITGGQLQTDIRLLSSLSNVYFNCTLSISTESSLAPPDIDLHAPRFVREIYSLDGQWQFSHDAEHIVPRFIDVGPNDVETFLRLLQSRQRRLPLVVVSEFDGRTFANDLHIRAASDLCGLGHTCRLGREGSWAITNQLGKEWSAYNGAVRLFWPFRANREHPRNHPLWTFDALTRRNDNEVDIRDWLRRQLRERLLEASTFLSDDPAYKSFEKALERNRTDQVRLRDPLSQNEVDEEVLSLRALIDLRDMEIANLRSNIETLAVALRSQSTPLLTTEEDEPPPATVADAVDMARRRFEGCLGFGDDVDDQVRDLNPGAGPPEKILRYSRPLLRCLQLLRRGPSERRFPSGCETRTSRLVESQRRFGRIKMPGVYEPFALLDPKYTANTMRNRTRGFRQTSVSGYISPSRNEFLGCVWDI